MFKGYKRAQLAYDNQSPDKDECVPCMEGDCDYHEYYYHEWINKLTTHKARKDDIDNGIKKGDLYRARYIVGLEIIKGVKKGIKIYRKRLIK